MGLSTEQTTAVIESVAEVVKATKQPEQTQPEFLVPLIVTIIGGIITTVFGVWYTKRRKKR